MEEERARVSESPSQQEQMTKIKKEKSAKKSGKTEKEKPGRSKFQ